MIRRRIAVSAMLAIFAIPLAASAGGWALASFDDVPSGFEAGANYDLEYTILQHGETPVDVGASQVRLVDPIGKAVVFDATPAGEPGRYAVSIEFASAGTWEWEVTMGMFGAHPMGSIHVTPAAPTSSGIAPALRWLLPAALVVVSALLAAQAVIVWKSRRTLRAD